MKDLQFPGDYTDLSGNEPHIQAGVGSVVTLWRLSGVIASTRASNVRDVGSIPVHHTHDRLFFIAHVK